MENGRRKKQAKPEDLAELVKRLMDEKRLSTYETARRANLSQSLIAKIIKGDRRNLTIDTLESLAKGLEVSPNDLYEAARQSALIDAEVTAA